MKTSHQIRVEKFMLAAGQSVPQKPCIPNELTRILRARLILEECLETVEALGFQIDGGPKAMAEEILDGTADCKPDLIEIIDGCCDIKVVTTGTLSACGLPDDPFQVEVDLNNLAKFGPGGHRRSDGKWEKPPNFTGPDIKGVLERLP
jgi:predicted HAD superfamily Cof-like phosphohydrolase